LVIKPGLADDPSAVPCPQIAEHMEVGLIGYADRNPASRS
jgi:hypothetical protein